MLSSACQWSLPSHPSPSSIYKVDILRRRASTADLLPALTSNTSAGVVCDTFAARFIFFVSNVSWNFLHENCGVFVGIFCRKWDTIFFGDTIFFLVFLSKVCAKSETEAKPRRSRGGESSALSEFITVISIIKVRHKKVARS